MLNGQQLVKEACKSLNINLARLVAATAIWAHPDCVKTLREQNNNPNALWKFNIRRAKRTEKRGQICKEDGCRLDDNTDANHAIKIATGSITEQSTFHVCHIYESTCYDKDYHLSIPNLILIPKEISALTDFDQDVISALKYRSYELYSFYYKVIPLKPSEYDDFTWRQPEPFTLKIRQSIRARKKIDNGYEIL